MKTLTAALALLTLSTTAFADEVRLKNGGRIVGIAREENGKIVVEVPIGTMAVSKTDVAEVIPGRTILHEYFDRRAQLENSGSASDFVALAIWAKSNGVTRFVDTLLQTAIRLDPENRPAHEMLGHVRHDNRWMTATEHMQALGYVRFREQWMKPEDRDAILTREAAQREAARRPANPRRAEQPAPAEPSIYTLGLPRYYTARGSGVWGGGYSLYDWPYFYAPFHGFYGLHHGGRALHSGGVRHAGAHHGSGGGHHGGFGGH